MADKTGLGCLGGMILWAVSAPSLGFVLFALVIVSFIGKFIGANHTLLMIYIIGAMFVSYVAPVILSILTKSWLWLIAIPVATTFIFAIPSSFVRLGGCDAGFDEAVWAMRAIPLMWAFEAFNPHDPMTC